MSRDGGHRLSSYLPPHDLGIAPPAGLRDASDRQSVTTFSGRQSAHTVARAVLVIAGALFIAALVPGGDVLVATLAVVWALTSPTHAIEALSVSWFLGQANPGIVTMTGFELFRWLILLAAFARVGVHYLFTGRPLPKAIIPLWLMVMITGLSSALTSTLVDVSLFKLATFCLGATTVLLAFHATANRLEHWRTWFLGLFVVVTLGGLFVVLLPVGYLRNGSGFQGILNHPQAYAVFLAPFLAWIGVRILVGDEDRLWTKGVFAVGCISLALTQGRTGALAWVLAVLSVFAVIPFRHNWRLMLRRRTLRPDRLVFTLGLIAVAAIASPLILTASQGFLRKGQVDKSVGESLSGSRGFLIERSLANFKASPLLGIGFGMPSDFSNFEVRRDPMFGLPVSAAVEKGVLPVAVLEETGILGALLTLVLLVALLRPTWSSPSPAGLALSTAAVTVNLGEALFFSFGGLGLLMWLLVGLSRIDR